VHIFLFFAFFLFFTGFRDKSLSSPGHRRSLAHDRPPVRDLGREGSHSVVAPSAPPKHDLRPPHPPKTEISERTVPGFLGSILSSKRNLRLGSVNTRSLFSKIKKRKKQQKKKKNEGKRKKQKKKEKQRKKKKARKREKKPKRKIKRNGEEEGEGKSRRLVRRKLSGTRARVHTHCCVFGCPHRVAGHEKKGDARRRAGRESRESSGAYGNRASFGAYGAYGPRKSRATGACGSVGSCRPYGTCGRERHNDARYAEPKIQTNRRGVEERRVGYVEGV
jgi:hypothetical protein